MDLDAYVAAHRPTWDRLDQLSRRARRPRALSGVEIDELVATYQATATHLSVVRTHSPDPVLIGRLSTLVARGRSAITGSRTPAWRDLSTFATVTFPVAVWRARWWCVAVGVAFTAVSAALGAWIAGNPRVQTAIASPEEIRQLVNEDFEDYYSSSPASDFAAQVWTNNAFVAAGALVLGVFLVPTVFILFANAVNVGIAGGLMAAGDRLGLFFGLILPHGLLELTAVFVAAATGLRLGWTVVDPGPRRRGEALGEEGRAAITVALGLVGVLLVSGVIEAFVTPSGLGTPARIAVGVVAEAAFIAYVVYFGRRAARAGLIGDLVAGERPDAAPVAG